MDPRARDRDPPARRRDPRARDCACEERASPPRRVTAAAGATRDRARPPAGPVQAPATMSEPVLGRNIVVHEPVVFGADCRVEDGAILGRVPILAATSSASRDDPGPTVLEDGAVV